MILRPPVRGSDSKGAGYYGAPRGNRKHAGVDFACYPGSKVICQSTGSVTKLGYPYSDDLSFRYVQITTVDGIVERYFYVKPCVEVGDVITPGRVLGTTQKLGSRYLGITEHFHFEVKVDGEHIDPTDYIATLDARK